MIFLKSKYSNHQNQSIILILLTYEKNFKQVIIIWNYNDRSLKLIELIKQTLMVWCEKSLDFIQKHHPSIFIFKASIKIFFSFYFIGFLVYLQNHLLVFGTQVILDPWRLELMVSFGTHICLIKTWPILLKLHSKILWSIWLHLKYLMVWSKLL